MVNLGQKRIERFLRIHALAQFSTASRTTLLSPAR